MTDDAGRVLAVDLGGTNIRVALVDTSGGTAGFVVAPTDAAKGPSAVVSRMLLMIRESLRKLRWMLRRSSEWVLGLRVRLIGFLE